MGIPCGVPDNHTLRRLRVAAISVGSFVAAFFTNDQAGAAILVSVISVHYLVNLLTNRKGGSYFFRFFDEDCDITTKHNIRVDVLAAVVLTLAIVALALALTGAIVITAVVFSFILAGGVSREGNACEEPDYPVLR